MGKSRISEESKLENLPILFRDPKPTIYKTFDFLTVEECIAVAQTCHLGFHLWQEGINKNEKSAVLAIRIALIDKVIEELNECIEVKWRVVQEREQNKCVSTDKKKIVLKVLTCILPAAVFYPVGLQKLNESNNIASVSEFQNTMSASWRQTLFSCSILDLSYNITRSLANEISCFASGGFTYPPAIVDTTCSELSTSYACNQTDCQNFFSICNERKYELDTASYNRDLGLGLVLAGGLVFGSTIWPLLVSYKHELIDRLPFFKSPDKESILSGKLRRPAMLPFFGQKVQKVLKEKFANRPMTLGEAKKELEEDRQNLINKLNSGTPAVNGHFPEKFNSKSFNIFRKELRELYSHPDSEPESDPESKPEEKSSTPMTPP